MNTDGNGEFAKPVFHPVLWAAGVGHGMTQGTGGTVDREGLVFHRSRKQEGLVGGGAGAEVPAVKPDGGRFWNPKIQRIFSPRLRWPQRRPLGTGAVGESEAALRAPA